MNAGDVDGENYDTGEIIPGLWRSVVNPLPSLRNAGTHNYTGEAEDIRRTYAEYFCNDGIVPWQWKRVGLDDDYIYYSDEEAVDNDLEEVDV